MSDSIEFNQLIPFNLIFDTDFGLIKLISKEYRADLFDKSVLDSDDSTIVNLLIARPFENPLCILTEYNSETKKTLDDYYLEFMGTRYDDILKLSVFTGIGNYAFGLDGITEITTYIYCKSKDEVDYLNEKCKGYKYKAVTPGTIGKLSQYDPVFIKSGLDYPTKSGPLTGHQLIVIRYGFNVYYDGNTEYVDYAKASTIFKDCQIATADLYGGKHE